MFKAISQLHQRIPSRSNAEVLHLELKITLQMTQNLHFGCINLILQRHRFISSCTFCVDMHPEMPCPPLETTGETNPMRRQGEKKKCITINVTYEN